MLVSLWKDAMEEERGTIIIYQARHSKWRSDYIVLAIIINDWIYYRGAGIIILSSGEINLKVPFSFLYLMMTMLDARLTINYSIHDYLSARPVRASDLGFNFEVAQLKRWPL